MATGRTKSGTIYFSVYYTDIYGKRVRKKVENKEWKTLKEAKQAERDFLNSVQFSSDMKFSDLYKMYVDHQKHILREYSLKSIMNMEKYWNEFMPIPLSKINASTIRKWQFGLLELELKDSSITIIQRRTRAIFNFAVKYDIIQKSPFSVPLVNIDKEEKEIQTWTIDEFKQFISVIDNEIESLAFQTLFYSGCRIGEFMAITPNDLKDGCLIINKQKFANGKIAETKNNSNRVVPLPEGLYKALLDMMDKYYGKNIATSDWLFCGLSYATRKNLSYKKNEYCSKAKVKQIRIHDFRHSIVTYLLADNKFTYKDVADFIGDNVNTIIATYGHSYGDLGNRIKKALNDAY